MISLEDLLKNWFIWKKKFSKKELLFLFRKFIFDKYTRCYFASNMPYDVFDQRNEVSWKTYVNNRENDAILSLHKPLWLARKKARFSLEELEKRTGISTFHLDKIEFGQDEQRFLGMLSFANGCNCTLEFGCTKDLCHTRYTQVSTLNELGAFFRRLRNRHHWSFQRLSNESGYSIAILKRIEHVNLNPTIVMMRRIVKCYDLELMTRTEKIRKT